MSARNYILRLFRFMVGCGALGCEYLKGFSLMGLGTKGGYIHITDMDTIEVSNLNRQFLFRLFIRIMFFILFRQENVGQQKSTCAAQRAKEMNPEMNIIVHETPVMPTTEDKFNDEFW